MNSFTLLSLCCALSTQQSASTNAFPLRPTAVATFAIESPNYQGANLDLALVAREIEDKLFPATFLRRPGKDANGDAEAPAYTLKVTLSEKLPPPAERNENTKFWPAYLSYELEGAFVRSPTEGHAFDQVLREAKDAGRDITKQGLKDELSACIDQLAKNRDQLVQGLLWYVPLARPANDPLRSNNPLQCQVFWNKLDKEFQMRLPFSPAAVGLEPQSEYLLYVEYEGQPFFHVVRSASPRRFNPGNEWPAALADGVVGRDRLDLLELANAARARPAGDNSREDAALALFATDLPLDELKPVAMYAEFEPNVTPDPFALLIDTRSIHVLRSRPTALDTRRATPSDLQQVPE